MTPQDLARHLGELRHRGFTVIAAVLDADRISAALAALEPLWERAAFGTNDFLGRRTRRVRGLLARTRALDELIAHPAALALAEGLLGGQVQLSIAIGIDIHPGESEQPLHFDDEHYPLPRPHAPLVLNTMWTLSEFRSENGATRVLPGSHRAAAAPAGEPAALEVLEAPPGSLVVWNGSVYHGAGANGTRRRRLGLNVDYIPRWLRQQENQYLTVPPELARALPHSLLRLIGYHLEAPGRLGQVEDEDPLWWLCGAGEESDSRRGELGARIEPGADCGRSATSTSRPGPGSSRHRH